MFRLVPLLAVIGCGRFGFDAADGGGLDDSRLDVLSDVPSDVVPLGHDEDGDGIRDVDDSCPHLVATQTDTDGDTVGDACDPNPFAGGDAIALFATMGAGDQPFTIGDVNDDGVWTQLADGLRFDGALGPDNNLYGHLNLDRTLANVRVALGIDIVAIIPGSTSGQNQIAVAVVDQAPLYYIELNQIPGMYDVASITKFDGVNYIQTQAADLATGMHPGSVFFQTTQVVNTKVAGEMSWPGEPYQGEVTDNVYQGASRIEMNLNNVHLEIRYLIIITSP